MISTLAHYVQEVVVSAGAMGVFWASVIEEIVVVIPSALVQLFAGAVLLSGQEATWQSFGALAAVVALPAAGGVLVGSLPIYAIAYFGGEPAIRRWGKWFGLSWERIAATTAHIQSRRRALGVFTLMRMLPIIPSAVASAVSGMVRLPFGAYVLSTLGGVFVRSFVVGALGWFSGGMYHRVLWYLTQGEKWGTFVIAGAVVVFLYMGMRYAKKRRQRQDTTI